jgi:SAM-dependent methyltransferase
MSSETHGRWERGLEHERTFWENWVAAEGAAWPDDFAMRFDRTLHLQPHVRCHLVEPLANLVRVLDVGAGPASVLGKQLDNHDLQLVAVDPLASFFDELLARHDLAPPVRTSTADGEKLTDVFDEATFDLAYARNSVDHSYEPITTIRQMLAVVKPGRRIVLERRIDEGEHEHYAGLHQWNFRQQDNRLLLWRPDTTLDIEEQLAGSGRLIEVSESDGWIIAALERSRRTPPAS